MYENKLKQARYVSKISPQETLKNLEIGDPVFIPSKKIKPGVVRATAKQLKDKGYDFDVTEAGLIDEVRVVRLK